jgi:murein DD-endopeptidase MepM/ murein hydrolase activator NlpD
MRGILHAPRALAGVLPRTLKVLFEPASALFHKALRKRLAAKIGWGCAMGVCSAFLFYFITGSIIPYVRSRTLELSLPEETEAASIINAYIEAPSPDDPPEVDVRPAASLSGGDLRLQTRRMRSGETVSGIAAAAGLYIDTVISFNRITDVRKVPVGTELKLPSQNGLLYTVKRGDSLGAIAQAHAVSTNAIADINNLESATIHPGQDLFIPGARLKEYELKKILGKLFIYPAKGSLSSAFGMRADPFTGVRRFHNGVDLAGPEGTHIFAAMAGKVVKIGVHPTYGKYVILSHADGYQSWYAHLSKILVEQGVSVSQGHLVGEMGNTGYSTASHLHFSIFKDGSPIDPFKFLH